jgi:methyltransferase-like protein/SAM-dependent methyltransferase
MTEQAALISYDQVPYPSLSYTQTHPDRLATVATLLGMHPPPINRCRVLELGSASGGNLIPMAYGLPESTFLGIDNSAQQIVEGEAMIETLRLENVALRHMDILDVDASLGQFDYIIAHGVFSWVPRPVQEKILEICAQNLAPDGVAYVSYNAYPGWHMLGIIRDMMLYHTRELTDPEERATQARALLDFLAESVPAENSAYGSFLNTYVQLLQGELKGAHQRGNAFLLHDELEEVNEPIYFHQFAGRAAQHGLQYLGEAEFRTMMDRNFPAQVSEKLREMSASLIELEQYMDFVRNRTFRQTLLCHQDVALSYTLKPEQLGAFYVASRTRPADPEPDVLSTTVVQFRASDGAVLSTDHPVTKAAMLYLAEIWPQAVSFDDLLSAARARLERMAGGPAGAQETDPSRDAPVLGTNLLKAFTYSGNLAELRVHAPRRMVLDVSERPIASPVARLQAQSSTKVTNLRHERVNLSELERYLLVHMDGSRDLPALVESLEAGPLAARRDGQPVQDAGSPAETLAQEVEGRVRGLGRAALLVG